tara:strand:- start:11945 stop:12322 length:378 start_codon:yes stop_codon:yes gene_type:complete
METVKTFIEYLEESKVTSDELTLLTEGLQQEWTPELEEKVDEAVDAFLNEYRDDNGNLDVQRFNDEMTNEGLFGSIIGGLTGFALGKSIGKMVAKVLGVEKGVLYDLLTSRLVGTALGAVIGKRF